MMWGPEAYQVGWDVEETIEAEFVVDEQGYQLVPDVTSPAIYLMQTLPAERDPTKTLLCFSIPDAIWPESRMGHMNS